MTTATGPLAGVRVLDLSRLAPGPYCSMVLGDLGAEVLLVEPPPTTRVPPGAGSGGAQATRVAAFNALRRNKRSIILNLKETAGRKIFMQLAADVDVVLEGFRPGVVERLGVDYAAVCEVNPDVIYCSLTGYGQDGPYVERVGHDINYISVAGALGLFGEADGPPSYPANLLADFAGGGQAAAMAVVAALFAHGRGEGGQYIDIAMSDGVMYLMASAYSQHLSRGGPVRGEDLLTGGMPYYNVYETSDDRWISIASLEPHFFANLCAALECEDLIEQQNDPEKRAAIFELFREKFREQSMQYWVEKLAETDICVGPVYTLEEALDDAQNQHRKMRIEVDDPDLGPVAQVGIGPKFSKTPGNVRTVGPVAGRDTDETLRGLGLEADEVTRLRADGVVA
ncbi:MAG: CaiB/BaiF CoA-transferase family protein [Dehalococcoidia bacterium]